MRATPRADRRLSDYAELVFAMFLWGSMYPAGKPVLAEVPPNLIALSRAVIACLVLGGLVLARGKGPDLVAELRSRPWSSAILGLLSFFGSSFLAMASLQYLPASVVGLVVNTSPLWLSLAAVALYRPPDSRRMLLGATIALVGVALVLFRDATDPTALLTGGLDLRGIGLAVVNAMTIAVSNVWTRRVMPGRDPMVMTSLAAGWAIPPFLVIALTGSGLEPLAAASPPVYGLILYIGIGCSALNFALFNHALQRVPAERATMFQYLSPLISAVLGFALLGEPATLPLVLGGAAILAGVALTQERGVWKRR